mmetsp:Transcript_6243/g.10503  ORF Transcript_6243/g.10503 Transcript_6243/m.10503 type:complete len:105 (-) Transcript_6243:759-1073(-)
MQILVATHNSKLWLPQVHNKEARRWLRAEAAARGVPDHRMVFSKRREDDRNIYLSTIVAADIGTAPMSDQFSPPLALLTMTFVGFLFTSASPRHSKIFWRVRCS